MNAMRRNLTSRPLTDHTSGATLTGTVAAYERTSYVGAGDPCWTRATDELFPGASRPAAASRSKATRRSNRAGATG